MNDPILNRFHMWAYRAILFLCAWLATFLFIVYRVAGGANLSWADWWQIFLTITGPDCPPSQSHLLAFIAIVSALPVLMIFALIGSWWRRQGVQSLRVSGEK